MLKTLPTGHHSITSMSPRTPTSPHNPRPYYPPPTHPHHASPHSMSSSSGMRSGSPSIPGAPPSLPPERSVSSLSNLPSPPPSQDNMEVGDPGEASPRCPTAKDGSLPLGWAKLQDEEGFFYFNVITSEKQRTKPTKPAKPPPSSSKMKPRSQPQSPTVMSIQPPISHAQSAHGSFALPEPPSQLVPHHSAPSVVSEHAFHNHLTDPVQLLFAIV